MPDTFRNDAYIVEVALSVVYKTEPERLPGDIVIVRRPVGRCGKSEQGKYLWLYLWTENDEEDLFRLQQRDQYGEQRFQIPLDVLAAATGKDLNRIRDKADKYQPFVGTDDDGWFNYDQIPLEAQGLVYDKAVGAFL